MSASWDLLGCVGLCVVAVALALQDVAGPFRVAVGLAFVLVAPGFAVVEALFPPHAAGRGVGPIGRAALTVATSVCLVPLVWVILRHGDRAPGAAAVVVALALVTVTFIGIAWLRRERARRAIVAGPALPKGREVMERMGAPLVLLVVLVPIFAAAWIATDPAPRAPHTEFSAVGPLDRVGEYPTVVRAGSSANLTLTIRNFEGATAEYRVLARWTSIAFDPQAPSTSYEELGSEEETLYKVAIGTGETDVRSATIEAPHLRGNYRLDLLLHLDDEPSAHRTLHFWVTVGR